MNEVWDEIDFLYVDKHQRLSWVQLLVFLVVSWLITFYSFINVYIFYAFISLYVLLLDIFSADAYLGPCRTYMVEPFAKILKRKSRKYNTPS